MKEVYEKRFNLPVGIMIHAKPATNKLPSVQKAAMKLNIDPLLDFG